MDLIQASDVIQRIEWCTHDGRGGSLNRQDALHVEKTLRQLETDKNNGPVQ